MVVSVSITGFSAVIDTYKTSESIVQFKTKPCVNLPPTTEEVNAIAGICLSVC